MIINEMQHELATWAGDSQTRKFDRLLRLIANRNWLAEAARIVLASRGAKTPGIDGIDKQKMQINLAERLAILHHDLLKGTYCPKPVRRIYIQKAKGKLRPLGIPTLTDRIVQRAMLAGHIERGLFMAASEGVPQGGVLSPLLSNIMLHGFDIWLEAKYLNKKARKDRWYWNFGIEKGRPIAIQENRQWKPAVAYCRYADDFVVIVKGTKAHAETIREECRDFLEDRLKL